ncbi:tripartite tricarboxylate transporter substrate binding protein [Achromobacter pestifer]|uniref:Tripartite tricarboxylate transporter substrate binding protein n=1 Tax=Achromobacter pestifer TaxID=1353889 RepID=A0A7D4E0C4_9BURK|nr:tripartite tricarboxylate transporter substrate binding protein [Achromobacter pestifer]QKH38252.1 tripartite tricarboxylate transporter substrate binding protein [Achromobacter pestifer]
MRRRTLLKGLSGALACTLPWSTRAAYPDKPLRIIVPLPAASPADVLARVLAERLQRLWGQPVVVENRPGATGMIGLDAVARAAPDGYTVGIMFLSHTVLPALFGKVSYRTDGDFAPIANLVWLYNVLMVAPGSDITDVRSLVEQAKRQPGKLSYGSGGNGSPAHLLGAAFCQAAGIDMLHVPYKGPAEAVQALMGGYVQTMFATASIAVPLAQSGKLRALAVTRDGGMGALPGIPTLAEAGVPAYNLKEWEGVVAPAGTPADLIAKWNGAMTTILAEPQVREKLAGLGMEAADANTPTAFAGLIRGELQRWSAFVSEQKLRNG